MLLDEISREANAYMTEAKPLALPEPLYEKLADPNFHVFYDAPSLVIIGAEAKEPWIVEDCSLAAENLMLATHASGLGACWIGLSQPFLATPRGKRMIGFSEAETPLAPIIIGHARAGGAAPAHKSPEIHWIE